MPPSPPIDPSASTRADAGAAPQQVLYIEDNPVNSALMAAMLEVLPGVEMLAAATPEDGLALACSALPRLVLVDIQLPGMDGYEVLSRLRAHPQTNGIPVIAVTGQRLPPEHHHGRAAGFAAYLTKPLHLPALLGAVCAALGMALPAGLPRA